ncbi:serine aminopeptidase domain-containing protein [Actinoplanes sp. DH11]|uniref:alpha/beta hydrolase family protein n=1 Tax=Actinoplanes sp. DH11 TaxID=2857011 RepID=UPI001E51747F|nr:alpha/beta hydrolase [Actinoplanes sp. DH11]
MRTTEVRIGPIAGTLREPDEPPAAALVIHPATATPERFYTAFATYLAENGIATVTYDYRGTGRSGSPRANRAIGMRDWIDHDVPAVAEWTDARFPGLPRLAVGHSVGGHALALGSGTAGLAGLVLLASHAASVRAVPDPAERRRVRLVLHLLGPALAAVLGYVPARRLGLGEDIPAAAMTQWGAWARLDGYFFDDPAVRAAERAATVTGPVLAIGFTDDKWATAAAIDQLTGHLTSAEVERRTYSPADGGVDAIGHHGFLRRGVRDTLWPELLTWLQKQSH